MPWKKIAIAFLLLIGLILAVRAVLNWNRLRPASSAPTTAYGYGYGKTVRTPAPSNLPKAPTPIR